VIQTDRLKFDRSYKSYRTYFFGPAMVQFLDSASKSQTSPLS